MLQSAAVACVHTLNEDGEKGAVCGPSMQRPEKDVVATCRVPSEMRVNKSLGSCEH